MKVSFVFILAVLIPTFSFSQGNQVASIANVSGANNASTVSPSLNDKRILPLFGGGSKSSAQIDEEIKFLSECDKSFGSRKEASEFFSARAWEYLQEGSLDTACYRFNLANLLDDKNIEPYWGLGVVSYQKENWAEAKQMLSKGVKISNDNVALLVDLSTVDLKLFTLNNQVEDLDESLNLLNRAYSIDPNYSLAAYNLSTAYFHKNDYEKAWEFLHKGRNLDFSGISLDFIELLKSKLPDPSGFFK
jgi:tetratricopeptide (TPR) repeat protein